MRLLNVRTLEFSEDLVVNIPKYVIASHRWFRNAETTFREVQEKRNIDKIGYEKVEGFAAYVKVHIPHVEWVWIDTCCINKTSDAETSEAINSMYKWYRNAEVCLAYLTDVETSDDLESFKRSEWFRRGWTLQELLAPQTVVFLTRAWEVIGYKGGISRGIGGVELVSGPSLTPSIVAVTGIPEKVLSDFGQNQGFTVSERLQWTAGRETTREEDMSYCLLGIFDLTMSVRYGEGGEKARDRLLAKIEKASRGRNHQPLQIRAISDTQLRPSSNVPFLRDPDFVYRTELGQIEEKLSLGRARVVLVGLGGVGKSQLAIEYCFRLHERSPDTWVLWVHASNATRFEESIRTLADDVKVPGGQDAKANIYQLVYNWLHDDRNGKWLIVLDNADDADFLFERPDSNESEGKANTATRALIDFLPICAHGSTIITSRSRAVAAKIVDDLDMISVQPMKKEHALVLLEKKLRQPADAMARRLAAALEYMPLAIAQAAAYIKKRAPRCSVGEYLDKFEKSDRSKTSLLNANSEELRQDRDAKNSIILTWQISFEHVNRLRRSAADLLSLMSFFDHQSIPESVLRVDNVQMHAGERRTNKFFPHEDDEDDDEDDNSDRSFDSADESFEDDIVILRDFHLISVAPLGATFEMHRLVQLAARKWLESQGQYQWWAKQSVGNLYSAFPAPNYENWAKCRIMLPHAKLALRLKLDDRDASIRRASVLLKAAKFALSQGSAEAEELAMRALEASESMLGAENKMTLACRGTLGLVLYDQGKFEAAEKMQGWTLEGEEKVLGREHPETLTSVNNLALVLQGQGKYEAAEEMHRRALEGSEKLLGTEHPDTVVSINNLSIVLREQGKYEKSEEMLRRSLEANEKVLGREHPDTVVSLNNLAIVLGDQGKYEALEEMLRRALEANEKVLGREHPDTIKSVNNLAIMLQEQGNYDASEEMCRRALEANEKVLGREHPTTLLSVHNLAYLLHEAQDFDAATSLYERAYSGFVKALGQSHPTTQACLEHFSSLGNDLQSTTTEESARGISTPEETDSMHSFTESVSRISRDESTLPVHRRSW